MRKLTTFIGVMLFLSVFLVSFAYAATSSGPTPWQFLFNFPTACSDGYAVSSMNKTSNICSFKGYWDSGFNLNLQQSNITNINSLSSFAYVQSNNVTDLVAKVASCTSGKWIFVSDGTYNLTAPLNITQRGCNLIGSSVYEVTIQPASNFPAGQNLLNVNQETAKIENIEFSGNNNENVSKLIYLGGNSHDTHIKNIRLTNFKNIGIHMYNTYYVTIEQTTTYISTKWNNTIAIVAEGANSDTIRDGHIFADTGILVNGTTNSFVVDSVSVEGSSTEFNQSIGIDLQGSVNDIYIINNRFESWKVGLKYGPSVGTIIRIGGHFTGVTTSNEVFNESYDMNKYVAIDQGKITLKRIINSTSLLDIPLKNLIGYYEFAENISNGIAYDSSIYARDGKYNEPGNLTTINTLYDTGFYMNGSTVSNTSYVSLKQDLRNMSALTIVTLVKRTDTNTGVVASVRSTIGIRIPSANQFQCGFSNDTSLTPTSAVVMDSSYHATDKWFLLACSFDGTTGITKMQMYREGLTSYIGSVVPYTNQDAAGTVMGKTMWSIGGSSDLWIGRSNGGALATNSINVDEVMIFDKVLSDEEFTSIWQDLQNKKKIVTSGKPLDREKGGNINAVVNITNKLYAPNITLTNASGAPYCIRINSSNLLQSSSGSC